MTYTWIFQADPELFDIDGFLAAHPSTFFWLVDRYDLAIEPRQQVFIWGTTRNGRGAVSGIIAEAKVVGRVSEHLKDDDPEPFWLNPRMPGIAGRVLLRLVRVAADAEILRRDRIRQDPLLRGLPIFRTATANRIVYPLQPDQADRVSALWRDTGSPPDVSSPDDKIGEDIRAVEEDVQIDATTRRALVQARRGQGKFREGLVRRWGGACAVTGVAVDNALRASHTKPWRHSDNAERLDPANGLLLAATLDALFDAGLVSFADNGTMLVSRRVAQADCERLSIPAPVRLPFTARERAFMAHHRRATYCPD